MISGQQTCTAASFVLTRYQDDVSSGVPEAPAAVACPTRSHFQPHHLSEDNQGHELI